MLSNKKIGKSSIQSRRNLRATKRPTKVIRNIPKPYEVVETGILSNLTKCHASADTLKQYQIVPRKPVKETTGLGQEVRDILRTAHTPKLLHAGLEKSFHNLNSPNTLEPRMFGSCLSTNSISSYISKASRNFNNKYYVYNLFLSYFEEFTMDEKTDSETPTKLARRDPNCSFLMEGPLSEKDKLNLLYQNFRRHFEIILKSFEIIEKTNPRYHPSAEIKVRPEVRSSRLKHLKKTLVLDLDETLVSCSPKRDFACRDQKKVQISVDGGLTLDIFCKLRPHTKKFIAELSKHFEIFVFTASEKSYANPIINLIDPGRKIITEAFFRENCVQFKGGLCVKDLSLLNRDLKDIILVDDSIISFAYQLENGIPILPFTGTDEYEDKQLLDLRDYLLKLVDVSDVRNSILKTFRWKKFQKYYKEPQKIFKKIFFC
jgi:Dullard-like phosphatase family protein